MDEQKEYDLSYLRLALELSQKSVKAGCFPAGAVVVENGEIVGKGISDIVDYGHAERNAADAAVSRNGERRILTDAILYGSLEPCLMCFLTAWQAGVRTFVYACEKSAVSPDYYGSGLSLQDLVRAMGIEDAVSLIHGIELQEEALHIIHTWEMSH